MSDWSTPSALYQPSPLNYDTVILNIPEFLADHLRYLGYTVIPPQQINPYASPKCP